MTEFILPSNDKPTSSSLENDEILVRLIPYEILVEYLADIELKKRTDPKAATTLLMKLVQGDVDIKVVEHAKAERLLRELVSLPLTMFMNASNKTDFDRMKKVAREVLRKWAD